LVLSVGVFLLLFAAAAQAQPRTVLDLDTRNQPVMLQDWGDYWIDTTGRFTPDEVARTPGVPWQRTAADAIYPVTTGQVMWVRFSVPPAPDTERWYLEVVMPTLDRASLYTLDGLGQWNEDRAGDQVAVANWPVPHRHPLLPIELSAEVPSHYLLRLENNHAISAPLRFISEARLSNSEQQVSLILGIFFGLTGLAAMVSALGALSLRDAAYAWFSASVVLLSLTQARITGIGGLHLWPMSPGWNDVSSNVLPVLALSASLMFIASAVSLAERSLKLHRLIVSLVGLGVIMAVALALLPVGLREAPFAVGLIVMQVCGIAVTVWAWRRGDRFAPWLLMAYVPVISSAAWTLLHHMGAVPTGFLTQFGMQLGLAVYLPLVMVVLMQRSQHRRENTRRIQGMDRVDPATGLINGHVFVERLMRMVARSSRLNHDSAVMLIDIVNADTIQRDFGRKAAEDLPLRVAERLLSTAREIDGAARLSERRFGMLVEGPFSAEDAATLGPRIVARCLMPYKGLHVDCVAQVRVAYALVPRSGDNAHGVLTQLEERLILEPLNNRRAVFSLHDKTPDTKEVRRAGLRRNSRRQEL
jgi:GGDEF domain-containing protein